MCGGEELSENLKIGGGGGGGGGGLKKGVRDGWKTFSVASQHMGAMDTVGVKAVVKKLQILVTPASIEKR